MAKTIIKSFGSSVHLSPNNRCITKTFDVQNNMVRIYLMTTVKKLVKKVDSLGSYMSIKGATFEWDDSVRYHLSTVSKKDISE